MQEALIFNKHSSLASPFSIMIETGTFKFL